MGVAYIRLIRYGVKWRVLSPERAIRLTAVSWAAGQPPGEPWWRDFASCQRPQRCKYGINYDVAGECLWAGLRHEIGADAAGRGSRAA